MRFSVDLRACGDHGQCTFSAPELFSIVDDQLCYKTVGADVYESAEVDSDLEEGLVEAGDMCPTNAITVHSD